MEKIAIPKIYVTQAFWGESYTQSFLNFSLPSLMAEGNLPYLQSKAKVVLALYTDDAGEEKVFNDANIKLLQDKFNVEVIITKVADILVNLEKRLFSFGGFELAAAAKNVTLTYEAGEFLKPSHPSFNSVLLTHSNLGALLAATKENAPCIFMGPDGIYSNKTLKYIWEALQLGKRAFMSTHLRVYEKEGHQYVTRYRNKLAENAHELNMSGADLVELGLTHLHKVSQAMFWPEFDCRFDNSPHIFSDNITQMYWEVDEHTVLQRNFTLHPLMLFPNKRVERAGHLPIDIRLVKLCVENYQDVFICSDSDIQMTVDLTPHSFNSFDKHLSTDVPDLEQIARWFWKNNDGFHERFLKTPIVLHAKAIDEQKVQQMVKASSGVIDRCLVKLNEMYHQKLL